MGRCQTCRRRYHILRWDASAGILVNPGEASGALVIYCGERVEQADERIFAVPWTDLTG